MVSHGNASERGKSAQGSLATVPAVALECSFHPHVCHGCISGKHHIQAS